MLYSTTAVIMSLCYPQGIVLVVLQTKSELHQGDTHILYFSSVFFILFNLTRFVSWADAAYIYFILVFFFTV